MKSRDELTFREEKSPSFCYWCFNCDTPLSGQPVLINFFKPKLFLASDLSSGFRRGISHFFTVTKEIQPKGWEKKNQRTIWTWVNSKHKKGKVYVWHLHSLCICGLTLACILRETSTKRNQQCWHLLALVNRPLCSSSGLSSRLSDFCWFYSLDSELKADRSSLPSDVDCLSPSFFVHWLLFSLGPSFPPPLSVSPEISRQRDCLPGAPPTYCHTISPNPRTREI